MKFPQGFNFNRKGKLKEKIKISYGDIYKNI